MKNEDNVQNVKKEKLPKDVSELYRTSKRIIINDGISTTHIPAGTILRKMKFSDDSKAEKNEKTK